MEMTLVFCHAWLSVQKRNRGVEVVDWSASVFSVIFHFDIGGRKSTRYCFCDFFCWL